MARWNIRQLRTGDDTAAYREIRLEALTSAPEAFAGTFDMDAAQPLHWWTERLERNFILGAFQHSTLLGVVGFFVQQGPKVGHKGTLWGMYVRPQARGAGAGRALAEAVMDHARGRVELIQLTVVSGNEAARRLYSDVGFVEYGREIRALKQDGRYYDEVLMAVDLGSR
jgi:ribosomal protein S18 acetylase RimI-like enzyme